MQLLRCIRGAVELAIGLGLRWARLLRPDMRARFPSKYVWLFQLSQVLVERPFLASGLDLRAESSRI